MQNKFITLKFIPKISSINQFIDLMSDIHGLWISRIIAETIEEENILGVGFRMIFSKNLTDFVLQIKPAVSKSSVISLTMQYDRDHAFTKYLDHKKDNFKENKYSLSIKSLSGNILVIPKGKYITIYDFCKKANQEEINFFWILVRNIKNELDDKKIDFTMATHAGSSAGHTVPHFHFRFEIN